MGPRTDGESGEDGGDAEGGGGLFLAFEAVADEEVQRRRERGEEGDGVALTGAFHCGCRCL